jgi:hypothetical protein
MAQLTSLFLWWRPCRLLVENPAGGTPATTNYTACPTVTALAMDLVTAVDFPREENSIRLDWCWLSEVPPLQFR